MQKLARTYPQKRPKSSLGLLFILLSLLAGCGGASVEQVEIPESILTEEIPDTAKQIDPEEFLTEVELRTQKGDTVAVDHARLEKLLPKTIAGYELDIDKSTTFETKNYTFSEATHVFYDEKEEYIEFIAGDYVADPDFFKVNLQRYNLAQGVEIEGIREQKRIIDGFVPSQVDHYFTWSLYNVERGVARVYIGVNYRYFVTIEATGQQGFLDLKKVKSWLNWEALLAE